MQGKLTETLSTHHMDLYKCCAVCHPSLQKESPKEVTHAVLHPRKQGASWVCALAVSASSGPSLR